MTRVRIDGTLGPGAIAELSAGDAHHLTTVLRMASGSELEAVDAAGSLWSCRLLATAPARVEVVCALPDAGADPACELEVWLPLLKGGRTAELVRQLTELGATRIVPWAGTRTVARPDARRAAQQVKRWRAIAREASLQCGRVALPQIDEAAGLPTDGPGVFFYEGGGGPAREVLASQASAGTLRILIGPEGGLADAEVVQLRALGWEAASLGARILKADTAVLATVTLALHALGEGGY